MPSPPLGLGYIASYLRKYHDTVEFNIISRSYEHNIHEIVKEFKPNVVGISSTTENYNTACLIANITKEIDSGILTIIGGAHITALPQNLKDTMDVGVLGEGEETFSEIIKAYESNTLNESTFGKIPGIVFWKEKQILVTEKRNLIKSIDLLPFPSRDLYEQNQWATIITSRGCPFKCIFCAKPYWSTVRFHSPQYVVNEIKELVSKYNVKSIRIVDDLFIADKKRVKEISRLIQEAGIEKKVDFFCQCRSDLIDEEIIEVLKSMNVNEIAIGLESGSESVLKRIKKGSVTVQQNLVSIELMKKYNINILGYFMIGAPDETMDEIIETFEFIKNSPIDYFSISVMIPFPGTEIWDYAKSRNLVNENMDWDSFEWDLKNNKKYLIIDDAVPKKDLIQMYFKMTNEIENRTKKRNCNKIFGKNLGPVIFQISKIPGVYRIGSYFWMMSNGVKNSG